MAEPQIESLESELSNLPLNTNQLPQINALCFEPLSAKYAPTNRLLNLITILVLALLIVVALHQPFLAVSAKVDTILHGVLWLLCTLGFVLTYISYLADLKKSFALREQDISYRSGLVFQSTISQPILRIQHVELRRGPIDRKMGLANLQVFSAGGALHTFEIPGLEYQIAEDMRQFILSHKDVTEQG